MDAGLYVSILTGLGNFSLSSSSNRVTTFLKFLSCDVIVARERIVSTGMYHRARIVVQPQEPNSHLIITNNHDPFLLLPLDLSIHFNTRFRCPLASISCCISINEFIPNVSFAKSASSLYSGTSNSPSALPWFMISVKGSSRTSSIPS